MKKLMIVVLLIMSSSANAQQIITKQEVDYIFSIDKYQYELYIRGIVPPDDWKVQINRMTTGSSMMSINPDSGFAMLLKPVFYDTENPPTKLIVGSFFHDRRVPLHMDNIMDDIHQTIANELGNDYSVKVQRTSSVPLIGMELHIFKTPNI